MSRPCLHTQTLSTLLTFRSMLNAAHWSGTWLPVSAAGYNCFGEDKLNPYNLPAERLAVYHRCYRPKQALTPSQHTKHTRFTRARTHTHTLTYMKDSYKKKKNLMQPLKSPKHG